MPLGDKVGWEKSESRYCGVETEFNEDIPQLLSYNISSGGFDFVVAPLVCFLLKMCVCVCACARMYVAIMI